MLLLLKEKLLLLIIKSLLLQLLLQKKLLLVCMIHQELLLLHALNWLLHNHILLVLLIDKMRLEKLLLLFNLSPCTSSFLNKQLLLVNILIKRLFLLYLNWLKFDLLYLLKDQGRLLFLIAVSKVLDYILLDLIYNHMSLLLMKAILNY